MKVFLGIDLGSTTSKAVIVDGEGHIIGRGITNTRSNYEVAAQIAQNEAEFNSRFTLLHRKLKLESNGTMLMASSTRRDMHMNGSCYVRLVCQANYTHIKRLIAYNTFKSVVN